MLTGESDVSYLAAVLDKGLVGDEAEVMEPEAGAPTGTMVIGLGLGLE